MTQTRKLRKLIFTDYFCQQTHQKQSDFFHFCCDHFILYIYIFLLHIFLFVFLYLFFAAMAVLCHHRKPSDLLKKVELQHQRCWNEVELCGMRSAAPHQAHLGSNPDGLCEHPPPLSSNPTLEVNQLLLELFLWVFLSAGEARLLRGAAGILWMKTEGTTLDSGVAVSTLITLQRDPGSNPSWVLSVWSFSFSLCPFLQVSIYSPNWWL